MTPRKTRPRRPGTTSTPTRDAWPHLAAFLSGYLHQDFLLDHATPADALRAFLADGSAAERRGLRRDWRAFAAATGHLTWREQRRALLALGGAWSPASRAALLALFADLSTDRI